MKNVFGVFFFMILLVACSNEPAECGTDLPLVEQIEFDFQDLHHQILGVKSEKELLNFIQRETIVSNFFLQRQNYPNDSIMAHALFQRFNNPHIDTLEQEINRVFGDLSQLKDELNSAYTRLSYFYPEMPLPKVKTVASGLENGGDLYVSDSLIVIGLDFYLGDKAKYSPIGFPQYILQKYRQEYIVPSILLLYGISPRFNRSDATDKTMLADMITYGKSYYFAKSMLPCTPDSVLIGYTHEEIEESAQNAPVIWAHFLDNELLYNQEIFLKQKYLGERPKTYEIGDECPGRIGAWLGWAIVSQYAQRKEVDLKELMIETDAKLILQESKYRPIK